MLHNPKHHKYMQSLTAPMQSSVNYIIIFISQLHALTHCTHALSARDVERQERQPPACSTRQMACHKRHWPDQLTPQPFSLCEAASRPDDPNVPGLDRQAAWCVCAAHLPDDVTGLLAPVPGLAAFSAVVSAVRGFLLPLLGRAEAVPGRTKPVTGRPVADMGRTAGEAPP